MQCASESIYDIELKDIGGNTVSMSRYRGSVLLIVNVASRCGYTPQYAALEELYRKYRDAGFAVLGFPCDQFGHQEPGTDQDVQAFCSLQYDVTFPMFTKIEVNGKGAHPLYRWLKARAKGVLGSEAIKWNFTKFLVDRSGNVIRRYSPQESPAAIEPAIVAALAASGAAHSR